MHVTTKCLMKSSTSIDKPYLLPAYADNSSYTRTAAYQRDKYTRGVTGWRQDLTFSFGDYGNYRLTP